MDKQKQIDKDINVRSKMIEEMAKVVQGNMCGDRPCEECNYHGFKTKILPRYCEVYLIAEKLYNAGYRKIPEKAVVLTREEYDELQIGKDFNYGVHSGESNMTAYYENIRLPETRKEMAEKFAELKTVWKARAKEYTDWAGNKVQAVTLDWLFADIDETCEEISEGKV